MTRYLRPLLTVRFGLYPLSRGADDQVGIIAAFTEQTLNLLHLIVSDDPGNVPYGLDEALQSLAVARPAIVSDGKFARLQSLAALR